MAAGYLSFGIALFLACIYTPFLRRNLGFIALLFVVIGTGLTLTSPFIIIWKPEFRLFRLPLYSLLQSIPNHFGETIHANVLASLLIVVLPLFLVLTLQHYWAHRWFQYLAASMLLIITGVLILTQSRGGYLSAIVGISTVVSLKWVRFRYAVLAILIVLLMIMGYLGPEIIFVEVHTEASLGGWDGRLDIWRNSTRALNDFLFTGIGIGTFTLVIPLLYPLRVNIEGFPHAHNLFLQVGLDLGLPGLIAYLAIIINLYVMLWQMLRRPQEPYRHALAIGATGSLTAMLVHGILDTGLWGTKLAFMPWLLFALITILHQEHHQSINPSQN